MATMIMITRSSNICSFLNLNDLIGSGYGWWWLLINWGILMCRWRLRRILVVARLGFGFGLRLGLRLGFGPCEEENSKEEKSDQEAP
ncbi:hypothetical protein HKD37_06G015374 [Glycine soja]|uniref:Uncharacterized protein n=1 Tax=Glycine max TaxID=3847 RepID=A0A0R0JK34_SOYBN|nr:hypothetical protein GmHk_06G015585 [Glycine max]